MYIDNENYDSMRLVKIMANIYDDNNCYYDDALTRLYSPGEIEYG